MELNLKGKTAIVTGARTGLGASIASVLSEEGANVIVNYVSHADEAQKFAESLCEQFGSKCSAIYGDVSKEEDVKKLFEEAENIYGQVDILVNSAGVWPTAYVKEMELKDWERTMEINLTGTFLTCRAMVQHLLEKNRNGKIVNIVSQAAFHGSTTGHAHYAAAKGGVVTFTKSLAREVADKGIRVNCVAPGMMRTKMNEKQLAENETYYINRIPVRYISEPKEVAYTVGFLCSDKADYITGTTIDVTGGMLMH